MTLHEQIKHDFPDLSETDSRDMLDALGKVVFGYKDPITYRQVPGILDQVADISRAVSKQARIDSWAVRIILGIVALRFLGLDNLTSIIKLIHGSP